MNDSAMKQKNVQIWISVFLLMQIVACFSKEAKLRSVSPSEAQGLVVNDFAVVIDLSEKDGIQNKMKIKTIEYPISKLKSDQASFDNWVKSQPKKKLLVFYSPSQEDATLAAQRAAQLGYEAGYMSQITE